MYMFGKRINFKAESIKIGAIGGLTCNLQSHIQNYINVLITR